MLPPILYGQRARHEIRHVVCGRVAVHALPVQKPRPALAVDERVADLRVAVHHAEHLVVGGGSPERLQAAHDAVAVVPEGFWDWRADGWVGETGGPVFGGHHAGDAILGRICLVCCLFLLGFALNAIVKAAKDTKKQATRR